ncbi:unnamed protein product [Ilex paraguariensis]|uniref:Uncharacterized protein n=1 Tax=Ilex paraguariensis TaxID=185542 RepID=A0ABC8TEF1_9AQUA
MSSPFHIDTMSISIEALAMAGANYLECSVDFEQWEHRDLDPPPPHLLAEEDAEEEHEVMRMSAEASHSGKKHALDDEGGDGDDDDFNPNKDDGDSSRDKKIELPYFTA